MWSVMECRVRVDVGKDAIGRGKGMILSEDEGQRPSRGRECAVSLLQYLGKERLLYNR